MSLGEAAIDGVAFGPRVHDLGPLAGKIGDGSRCSGGQCDWVGMVLGAQAVAGEGDGAAGVFLLGLAHQVGGEADLGLHFLLAVAEVVVGDEGDHDAARGAAGELERLAVVVALIGRFPADAVAALALGGLVEAGQAEFGLGQAHQVGREDDAAGMAGPVGDIEAGVVLGQDRIAGVAEDGLDEIEIAHQAAGGEEADLHRLLRADAGDLGADDGAEQQRAEQPGGLRPLGREGQREQLIGRVQGVLEELGEHGERDGDLVAGNGQPDIGDMERALGGAAVAARIVQDTVAQAVGVEPGVLEVVAAGREGEFAGDAGGTEAEGLAGQKQVGRQPLLAAEVVEELLDAGVGRAAVVAEQAGLLAVVGQQAVGKAVLEAIAGRRTACSSMPRVISCRRM